MMTFWNRIDWRVEFGDRLAAVDSVNCAVVTVAAAVVVVVAGAVTVW